MPPFAPSPPVRGPDVAQPALDLLIDNARAGSGQVLVLRGVAGIGKSALLGYAVDSAPGSSVLRTAGVESDMELAFARIMEGARKR